jgi:hypothetical protein
VIELQDRRSLKIYLVGSDTSAKCNVVKSGIWDGLLAWTAKETGELRKIKSIVTKNTFTFILSWIGL